MGIFIICRVCGANSPLLPWFRRQKVAKRGGGICALTSVTLYQIDVAQKNKNPQICKLVC